MTTYNYLTEMQSLCFKAGMALKGIGDEGMKDFYLAADTGFYKRLETIQMEEADQPINQSQMDCYLMLKDFVTEKEKEAAKAVYRKPTKAEKNRAFLNDMFEEAMHD